MEDADENGNSGFEKDTERCGTPEIDNCMTAAQRWTSSIQ